MRITSRNQMMSHLKYMNTTLNNLSESNKRMSSQRKFTYAYEDVAGATKAMRLRNNIRSKDLYKENIRDTRGRINSAEDAVQTSIDVLRTTSDRVLQALNGTYDDHDREIIAKELKDLQGEILSMMNTTYTDKFVFGAGGGASPDEMPFSEGFPEVPKLSMGQIQQYDANGKKLYTTIAGAKPVYDAAGNAVIEVNEDNKTNLYVDDPKATVPTDPKILMDPAKFGDYFEPKMEEGLVQATKQEPVFDANGMQTGTKTVGIIETAAQKTLTYHGMPVDDLTYNKETGKIEWYDIDKATGLVKTDPQTGQLLRKEIPYNEQNYIDVGIGYKFTKDENGEKVLDPQTALPFTFSGVEIFGFGKTDGMSNNVYGLLGEIITALEDNDTELLSRQFNHISDVRATLLSGMTEIGTRTNFLDDLDEIHANDKLNFQTRQKDVEAVDLPEESMYNKDYEMAWMITLQLGAKILPSSLFDFMR